MTRPDIGAAAAACLLAACLFWLARPPAAVAQEAVEAGRAMRGDASIKIWNGAGSVRVEGWEADSLHVRGDAEAGEFFFHADGAAAKLGMQGQRQDVRARLVVRVPAGATVWIRTATAPTIVRGVEGSVDVHSVSGPIEVEGEPAHLNVESIGGDLDLRVVARILRARTGSGHIVLAGEVEDLTLSAVGGALTADVRDLRRGRLTTVEGDLRFTGSVDRGGSLVCETHSGDAVLRLGAGIEADFELSTFEGRITAPLAPESSPPPRPSRDVFRFETGAGGAEVVVRSYSGSIDVREAGGTR